MELCDPTLDNKFLEFMKSQSDNVVTAHVVMTFPQHDQSSNDSSFLGSAHQPNDWLC
ncbi:unnamed protein product [Cuscuta europaea]|uniref:Uncharacterized protein n=1 Tax=Cuscuta europaea TaxID=41803 RepID=A0A9P0ZF56_CUSEU|nr:unnamed protein product [Cuscuta europaea]